METLVVKNFLVIKEASLDVKKINIIIGSQGTGKSVLAKTLYLLKNLENSVRSNLIKCLNVESLNKELKNKFISIFPEYTWKSQNFEILYKIGNIAITIKNNDGLDLIFSENLVNDYNKILEQFILIKENIDNESINSSDDEAFNILPKAFMYRRHINKLLSNSNLSHLISSSHFIPASRAFFSLFYENLFSILNSASNLDPFLMEFGSLYESFRSTYNRHLDSIQDSFPLEFSKQILNGDIVLKEEKCFIVNENQSIELIQASSGQQEALPMLQTLAVLSIFSRNNSLTFIEEPEAHLFPTSQANVMKLLSFLNNKGQNFFITTHSPYILSELNNYLYAQDLIKRNLLSLESFESILPSTSPIDIDDVSAYKIEDGILTSIIDNEFSMIDSDELDKASGHASDIYNQLLEFEAED